MTQNLFRLAAATMPSPMGPHPEMTTTSLNWIFPNSTPWIEHANGSTKAACLAITFSGTWNQKTLSFFEFFFFHISIFLTIYFLKNILKNFCTLWTLALSGKIMYSAMAPLVSHWNPNTVWSGQTFWKIKYIIIGNIFTQLLAPW